MAGPWTSSLALFEDSGVPAPDWVALGLACAILGCFLVANAILFRHPRRLVREFFGTVRPRLHSIRDYIFHRSQTHLGFFYLMLGFGLQLYGRLTPAQASASSQPALPVIWVGILILSAAVLEGLSWWWSRRLFRRYVRAQLAFKPHDFDGDMATAVEVGELFDVEARPEDTVQTYMVRLLQTVGVPPQARSDRGRGGDFPQGAGKRHMEDPFVD
ncbi:MAG: hypothetical protein P8N31_06250 [Planctomycetota bacterium]|nr:hypothetical protein [Planctomycetota bacterium]MDG2143135.1 hypothetical protein [Planctomycetota bacterium]